ncbi:hypothetical protein CERZMDRAFT_102071 [Cercospora zeae-maydis SCOH1-5]|uniref:F-box domain-containing protein n=1 Tax=Cercospora zeae-maydis SCOH1-5 TaxID=717836 RepID=A0A6A6F1J3_9PEZI|nr:hypothetical protein CERZMDRAFT_102071 [Cercospora zeae-maydis SCOH1-5]
MSLHDLSIEILHLICKACEPDSIQDLRLTSQKLCTVANKYLLPELVICLKETDLRRLNDISKGPEGIRTGVKSLIIQADACAYTTDESDQLPSLQEWMSGRTEFLLQSNAELVELRHTIRSRRQTPHRARYLEYLDRFVRDTRVLQDDPTLGHAYYAKFKRLYTQQKTLFGISISHSPQQMPAVIISKMVINTEHSACRNAGISNQSFLETLTIPHRCPGLDLLLAICEVIVPVAIEAGLKVDDYSLTGITPTSVQHSTPNEVPEEELPVFFRFFRNIRKMFTGFNGANAKDEDYDHGDESQWIFYRDKFAAGGTTYWLPFMPQLEELSLLYPVAPVLEWRVDIRDALGEAYIPNLTFLQISNFQCDTEGLERYLLLHKDTLQD